MSFQPYNLEGLKCAKRLLTWAGATRRMMWREVNLLMACVRDRERAYVACITKEAYATYSLAERVAKRAHRDHEPRQVVHCGVCHRYHITHVDPHARRAKARLRHALEEQEGA